MLVCLDVIKVWPQLSSLLIDEMTEEGRARSHELGHRPLRWRARSATGRLSVCTGFT
jgi:hypothetical protein